jgi:hypothetical protein
MKLNKKDKDLLREIGNGADIYGYEQAVRLRALEKKGIVIICEPLSNRNGKNKQPYFGCIAKRLTPKENDR